MATKPGAARKRKVEPPSDAPAVAASSLVDAPAAKRALPTKTKRGLAKNVTVTEGNKSYILFIIS